MQNKLFIVFVIAVVGGFIWFASKNSSSSTASSPQVSGIDFAMFSKGDKNASVKMVQYSDFLCPSCSQVSLGVIPKIITEFVDTGKVYFEFKPLAFIAPGSQLAAEGAFCAGNQNKFWQYHDASYKAVWSNYFSKGIDPSQVPLYSTDGVIGLGALAGVDAVQFDACVKNRDMQQQVTQLTEQSQANGINGTPYFIVNDTPIKGVPSYEVLKSAIQAKL